VKKIIVGISGKAESGKNSFAELARSVNHNIVSVDFAFADEVKKLAFDLGWDGRKDEKGRAGLILIGEGAREHFDKDIWIKKLLRVMKVTINHSNCILGFDCMVLFVTDMRFENESEALWKMAKEVGAEYYSVRIERPGHENRLTKEQRENPSETSLDTYAFDYVIVNDGTYDDFKVKVHKVMDDIVIGNYL
jgi:hypothetical protein